MTSKLRRPQLFTYTDGRKCLTSFGPLSGSPSGPPPPIPPKKHQLHHQHQHQHHHHNHHPHSHLGIPAMEVGVASYNGVMRGGDVSERSPGKGLHVNFTEKGEVKERREKFLTAKYGSHQMSLIRKRLAVEMWLYDELQKLYESADSSNPEVDVDIDELLDMDDDAQRRRHLQDLLIDAKKSPHDVKKFVNDLLERTKTL